MSLSYNNIFEDISHVWLTSDLHLDHKNILQLEPNRANIWKSVPDMSQGLIDNWNMVVDKDDFVIVLGDFCFNKSNIEKYCQMLNGTKILVFGNHDHGDFTLYQSNDRFTLCRGMISRIIDDKRCIFTHIPVHPTELSDNSGRYDVNFHGHIHSKKIDNIRYVNVGVDANNFKPINLADTLAGLNFETKLTI